MKTHNSPSKLMQHRQEGEVFRRREVEYSIIYSILISHKRIVLGMVGNNYE